ncbi:hypothetical protein [Qipengyuania algicida]|uniref:hypothetical protein n=1 Tax=Qipengyuania algicida TaxID=1836209 RepID=UPI001369E2F7|nr:hypothetical protein [Qipengyuania algicida]
MTLADQQILPQPPRKDDHAVALQRSAAINLVSQHRTSRKPAMGELFTGPVWRFGKR